MSHHDAPAHSHRSVNSRRASGLTSAWSSVQRNTGRNMREFGRDSRGRRTPARVFIGIVKWLAIAVLAAIVAAIVFFILMYIFTDIPGPGDIPTAQRVTLVANDNKTVLGTIIPEDGNRKEVAASDIPQSLRYAAMAAEDRDFETNNGFSLTGFGRAALGQITGNTSAGGGSTITQQYVKNALVGNQHSYWRKFKELVLSMKMANQWSKNDILTAYLNTIYFGRGAYGVETASQAYFGKHVKQLNPSQSALLAALIQQPSNLDPANNKEASMRRWEYVVNGMQEKGWIAGQAAEDMEFPKTISPKKSRNLDDKLMGPNGLLKNQVLRELEANGIDEQTITSEGLRIVTTISPQAQKAALDTVKKVLHGQPKNMRTAAVSIDPTTGGVLAYYGGSMGAGYDYAMAPQMTGSSFKVFTLAAALDQGIPLTKMYSSAPYKTGNITIENSDGMSCGVCTIQRATVLSLNTSYYRLMMDLKNNSADVARMAHKAGIPKSYPGLGKTLQNPDGTIEGGITLGSYLTRPFDMAVAYATFAARGYYHEPFFVLSASANDGKGRMVYQHAEKEAKKRVKTKVADNISYALEPIAASSNNHGIGRPSAAKTGTVQLGKTGRNRDAWMVGYTPQISTAVWVGTQNGTALQTKSKADVWGSTLPSDIWQGVMEGALKNQKVEYFHSPEPIGDQYYNDSYYGDYSGGERSSTTTRKRRPEIPSVTITRPTIPGIPGLENPFAPPVTRTQDPPDGGGNGDIFWR